MVPSAWLSTKVKQKLLGAVQVVSTVTSSHNSGKAGSNTWHWIGAWPAAPGRLPVPAGAAAAAAAGGLAAGADTDAAASGFPVATKLVAELKILLR